MSALIAVVAITLLVSAMCSLFEATLYSTRVASLEAVKKHGQHVAAATQFLRLKRDIEIPTSAILILNTVANTAGATVAGMLAADALGSHWIPVFSGLLTLSILFFAEILPKTYGATRWQTLWPLVVWPLIGLERVLRPLIWITQWFAGLFIRKRSGPSTTEDEIVAMIRMGADTGQLSQTELRLLTAVFRFDGLQAQDVMVPRLDVVWFDVNWEMDRYMEVAAASQHTRYPLCDGSLDNILGLIHIKDVLHHTHRGGDFDPRALARPLVRIPNTTPIQRVMHEMQRMRPHMAAVIDEHGTTVGVITLENVLEQLVGTVQDEFDREEPEIVGDGPGRYVVLGSISLSHLKTELDLPLPTDNASTLSGVLVERLGRLARAGDKVDLPGVRAEVLDVAGNKAARVRLVLSDNDTAGRSPVEAAADDHVEGPSESA